MEYKQSDNLAEETIEYKIIARITFKNPTATEWRKEVGPISMNFEIPKKYVEPACEIPEDSVYSEELQPVEAGQICNSIFILGNVSARTHLLNYCFIIK